MRWRAVRQCVEKKSEAAAQLLFTQAERLEQPLLNILPMDSNAARTKLIAVQNKVVAFRPHFPRRRFQFLQVFVNDSRKWMLSANPNFIRFAPLEERKPREPQEFPLRFINHAERFAKLQAQLTGDQRSGFRTFNLFLG